MIRILTLCSFSLGGKKDVILLFKKIKKKKKFDRIHFLMQEIEKTMNVVAKGNHYRL